MDEKTREGNREHTLESDEEKQLPEELWEMVRSELQQAAQVLRTLTDPLFADEREASEQPAQATAETQGWFARLVEQGRHITHPRG